ncbi:MAG TPA: hypothetical protein VF506_00575, partial [Streptosporangiaceae bacterium]
MWTAWAKTIATIQRIGFGLMGSELVRLAAAGRIVIAYLAGMIDTGQVAFGGLAHAVGLSDLLYRGRQARPLRK